MKSVALVSLGLAVASVLLGAPAAGAQCSPTKIPVTLMNPAGKVIELCLPENAIAGLQEGAAGSGAELYQGTCPCWKQDELEGLELPLTFGGSPDGNCVWAKFGFFGDPPYIQFMAVSTGGEGDTCLFTSEFPGGFEAAPNGCYKYEEWQMVYQLRPIDPEEAAACVGILKTLQQ